MTASIRNINKIFIILSLLLIIAACSSWHSEDGVPHGRVNLAQVKNAIPRPSKKSKYGNPKSYVVFGKRYYVRKDAIGFHKRGIASWYGRKFQGRRTSSGEIYNPFAMTAANKTLPLPSYVKVTNLENGREIIVKVNDRGPFKEDRIIDLSYVAAAKLGMLKKGTALVDVQAINPRQPYQVMAQHEQAHEPDHPILYLQAGAFNDFQNAKRLQHRIQQITANKVEIKTSYRHLLPMYRVRIGPLASVKEYDQLAYQISHDNLANPIAVVN